MDIVDRKGRRIHTGNLVAFEIVMPEVFQGFMVRVEGCERIVIVELKPTPTTPSGS